MFSHFWYWIIYIDYGLVFYRVSITVWKTHYQPKTIINPLDFDSEYFRCMRACVCCCCYQKYVLHRALANTSACPIWTRLFRLKIVFLAVMNFIDWSASCEWCRRVSQPVQLCEYKSWAIFATHTTITAIMQCLYLSLAQDYLLPF